MHFPIHDEATGQMCFSAALLVLKRGGTVSRASWPDDGEIFYDSEILFFCRGGALLVNLSVDDLMATDWIEVGETP